MRINREFKVILIRCTLTSPYELDLKRQNKYDRAGIICLNMVLKMEEQMETTDLTSKKPVNPE